MDDPVTSGASIAPSDEHDACGVGFVAHIKGARSHSIVRSALDLLINLEHRGACGSDPDTGDGAGILIQMPDRFFRKARAVRVAAGGRYGAGLVFLPHDARHARELQGDRRAHRRRRRPGAARLARGADRPVEDRTRAPRRSRRSSSRSSSAGDTRLARTSVPDPGAFERKLYIIRKRIERDDRRHRPLHLRPVVEDADLQGHADGVADRGHVSRSVGRRRRIRARARAPALLDQHLPVVAARAPVSLRRAQRRDQHAARQHQLDEGARGPAQVERLRRRPAEGAAGDHARAAATPRPSTTCSSSW